MARRIVVFVAVWPGMCRRVWRCAFGAAARLRPVRIGTWIIGTTGTGISALRMPGATFGRLMSGVRVWRRRRSPRDWTACRSTCGQCRDAGSQATRRRAAWSVGRAGSGSVRARGRCAMADEVLWLDHATDASGSPLQIGRAAPTTLSSIRVRRRSYANSIDASRETERFAMRTHVRYRPGTWTAPSSQSPCLTTLISLAD